MHPAAKARLRDSEILRDLTNRLLAGTCELHRATPKLLRMWPWHPRLLSWRPRSHSVGVRVTGGSSDGLKDFIDEKKEQEGEALPLEGYSPTVVLLKDGFLRVFLSPLPADLSARFFEPDERNPGDLDRTAQQIAGLLGDGRMWQLSIPDAAHLIEKGRLSIAIDAAVSGTGRPVPLLVVRSARGRRYLRTPPDDVSVNDLRDLPRIPTPG